MEPAGNMEALISSAKEVLRGNDLGRSTKPAPQLYPHQWNWDSCFIAIGISRYDSARAAEELRSLLRGQWRNGLVPQIIFKPGETGYFPGPDVWQSSRSPEAPAHVQTSGITQPPMLAVAALAVWRNATDRGAAVAFLREVYPKILAYHRFLYEERDPDHSGLVVVVHPWESGLDNSPPYLDAGSRVRLTYRPSYQRLDTLHVAAENRPTNKDYDLYVYLLELMRATNWNQRVYLETAPLQIQDVLFNSILARANAALEVIAHLVGEDAEPARVWREKTAQAINDVLWDEEDGTYYSFDRVAGRLLKDDTVAGFGPLFGGVTPPDRMRRLIDGRLENTREFRPSDGYAVPTTALDSPWFNPENYWLGPVWANTNWLVIQGLVDAGYAGRATALAQQTIELVTRSGFREYFNPLTGQGYGADSFSWTAALAIDLVAALQDMRPGNDASRRPRSG